MLNLTVEKLKELTIQRLPEWPEVVRLDEIVKGGSDRHFYRLHFARGATAILMTYTRARPDNLRFVDTTDRLKTLGVRVPEIHAHDDEKMCVWLEDLGNEDLFAFRDADWGLRKVLYQAALSEVAKLHVVAADELSSEDLARMEPGFDEALYAWEQEYFLTHFVRGLRGVDQVPEQVTGALETLRKRLSGLPRGLLHRDFQSQNLMVRNGQVWLIDYQGVRPGLAEYDLASLLLDPYVELKSEEREELLDWYARHVNREPAIVRERYWLCAAQRLMQALGAYGNLSLNLGKPQFARHVPVALARLKAVCERHELLNSLGDWLEKLSELPDRINFLTMESHA